ncbi:DOPA 4,5-dioxygenase family protein [Nitrosomonas oligotropha]|nr:DOPA 4,5-dioxygenase family protein [Nitrosomonas oligotropha]
METFHAHIYFSENESLLAEKVRDNMIYAVPQAAHVSELILDPSGPHPKPMFEIHIPATDINKAALLIDKKRAGLPVLIHPVQADKLAAYTVFARWLGEGFPLNLEAL